MRWERPGNVSEKMMMRNISEKLKLFTLSGSRDKGKALEACFTLQILCSL